METMSWETWLVLLAGLAGFVYLLRSRRKVVDEPFWWNSVDSDEPAPDVSEWDHLDVSKSDEPDCRELQPLGLGFGCTQVENHPGPHVARGWVHGLLAVWEDQGHSLGETFQ